MNENQESHWILDIGMVLFMAILACGMVAPIFGPMIRRRKFHKYALYSDYEKRADAEMPLVWLILWLIAAASWTIILFCGIVMSQN